MSQLIQALRGKDAPNYYDISKKEVMETLDITKWESCPNCGLVFECILFIKVMAPRRHEAAKFQIEIQKILLLFNSSRNVREK